MKVAFIVTKKTEGAKAKVDVTPCIRMAAKLAFVESIDWSMLTHGEPEFVKQFGSTRISVQMAEFHDA